MVLRAAAVAVVVPFLAGGCFKLERSDGLRPGDIRVFVVDEDGAAVVGARVIAVGTARSGITDSDGRAVVGPMPFGDYHLRVELDADNDGVVEAGAILSSVSTIDKPLLGELPRLSFVEHRDVAISAAGSIAGTVACPAGRLCRVAAFRVASGATLPIEANAGVDVDGRWRLDGVLAGEVQVAAFAWTPALDTGSLAQLIAATNPDAVGVVTASIGDDDVAIELAAAPSTVSVGIDLRGAPAEGASSDDERPAVEGNAFFYIPGTSTNARTSPVSGTVPASAVEIPVGVIDVSLQVDGLEGRLAGVVGVPGMTEPLPPITIDDFSCNAVAPGKPELDCNSDGLADYASAADVDLDNDGVRDDSDTDVDGDGISDADEPTACRFPGSGGDRDGDCLCDSIDPLPDCQSNDPLLCALPTPPTCS